MTTRPRVAIATSADLDEHDEDAPGLRAALAAIGVPAAPSRWDDPSVDWAEFDLVVIRSTWDYAPRRDQFVGWAQTVPRLLNSATIVRWNTHKGYLAELASAGVPVVPTVFLPPGAPVDLPDSEEFVVKPAVGAGSVDTTRYCGGDRAAALSHVARLHRGKRTAMVQPYLSGVDEHGETALIYLGGAYSHSIRKAALLGTGKDNIDPFGKETITPREPDPVELAVAGRVLEAVPGGADRLLYARVDLIPGPAGTPLLLELELTEPSLFLCHALGATERFAAAIAEAADRAARAGSR